MADGWIEWHGGDCPVSHQTLVDIKTNCGNSLFGWVAGSMSWKQTGWPGDIAQYKLCALGERDQKVPVPPGVYIDAQALSDAVRPHPVALRNNLWKRT